MVGWSGTAVADVAGGHNVTRERFQVLLDPSGLLVDENYKGNLRAIVLDGDGGGTDSSRANGKMKPNNRNRLQTICTFRGDSLVNDPRLKLQNAGRTHAF